MRISNAAIALAGAVLLGIAPAVGADDTATKLMRAIAKAASEQELLRAIENQSDAVAIRDGKGWSALHYAAEKGNIIAIKALIARKADINAIDKANSTPLYVAAQVGAIDAVRSLLESGAAIDAPVAGFRGGTTPLDVAASRGYEDICELLLEAGASILPTKDQPRRTKSALHWACLGLIASTNDDKSNREVIALLVKHGGDLKWTSTDGKTPLDDACSLGNVEIVRLLLADYRDKLRLAGGAGKSSHPLIYTLQSSTMPSQEVRREIVRVLVQSGIKPSEYENGVAKMLSDPQLLKILEQWE